MALPATGSTITMSDIRTFFLFEGDPSSYVLGTLGTYIGISVGTTISMSATFGGLENSAGAFFLLNEYVETASDPAGQLSGSFDSLCLDTWPGQTGSDLGVMFALGGVYSGSTTGTAGLVKCNGGGTITTYTKGGGRWLGTNPSMYSINGTKYLIVDRSLTANVSFLKTFNSSGTETNSFQLDFNVSREVFFYNKANDRFYAMDIYNGAGTGLGTMKRYTLSGTNDANIAFPTPNIGSGTITSVDVRRSCCVVPGMDAILVTGYFIRSTVQYFFVYMFDGATDTWYKLVEGTNADTIIPGSAGLYTIYSSNVVMSHDRRYIAVEMEHLSGDGTYWYRCYQKTDGDWTTLAAPLVKEGDQLWDSQTFARTNNFKTVDAFYGANGGVFVSCHYQQVSGLGTSTGLGRVFDFETGTQIDSLTAASVTEWNENANSKFPFIQSQRDITTTNQIKNVGGNFYQYGYATSRYESRDPRVRYEMIIPLPNT